MLPNDPTVYDITGNENRLPLTNSIKPSYYNGRGLVCNSSHHVIFEGNTVFNCPSSGIRIEGSDYATVRNNTVYQNTYWTTQGVGAVTMAANENVDSNDDYKIIIENNLVYNNENRLVSWNPTKSFINYEIDEGAGIFMTRNADTYLRGKFKIVNNIVYNCGTGGVICHFTNNALIAHNSLYYNGTTGVSPSGGIGVNTTSNVKIANNIVYARPTKWALGSLSGQNNQGLFVDKNIVFNEGGVPINNVISTGYTVADPKYTAASSYNFTLLSTSTAINAANEAYSPLIDFYGNTRSTPDIGAVEYSSSSLSTNQFVTDNFLVYPNPTTDYLTIANYKSEKLQLFTLNGQDCTHLIGRNATDNSQINLENISQGVYLLIINGKTIKIIKN